MNNNSEIRFLGDLQRLSMKPGDKFVLMLDDNASDEHLKEIKKSLEFFVGTEHKVLVLSRGMKLGVIGE